MNDQAKAQLYALLFGGTTSIIGSILIQLGIKNALTQQICQLLAIVVPLGIAYWMSKNTMSDNNVAQSAAKLDSHAVIAAAASVPGVSEIVIDKNATDGAAAAAANPALTNVNKAS